MKRFKKALWLQSANEQIRQGVLSQREVDDALEIWVNNLDGKTETELQEENIEVRPEWLA